MPFTKGIKIPGQGAGRKPGSKAGQAKSKFISEWARIFREEGRNILEELAKENPTEYLRLGLSQFPKEIESTNGGGVTIRIEISQLEEETL